MRTFMWLVVIAVTLVPVLGCAADPAEQARHSAEAATEPPILEDVNDDLVEVGSADERSLVDNSSATCKSLVNGRVWVDIRMTAGGRKISVTDKNVVRGRRTASLCYGNAAIPPYGTHQIVIKPKIAEGQPGSCIVRVGKSGKKVGSCTYKVK